MQKKAISQTIKSIFQLLLGVGLVVGIGLIAFSFIPGVKTPSGWHTIQPPNDVMAMVIFQGKLWAGGRDGLYVIDPISFKLIDQIEFEVALAYVSSLLVDEPDQTLWVGHLNGLSRYRQGRWEHITTADGLAHDQVLSLGATFSGDLLVGTAGGLSRFNGERWKNYTTADGLASNSVDVIAVDSLDRIWLGSRNSQSGGVSMYDGARWVTLTTDDGLPHNSVNTIFFTEDGSTWFGCGFSHLGGLAKYDGGSWEYMDTEDGLPSDHIRLIYKDRFNIIWIGTEYSGIIATNHTQPVTLFMPENGLVGWEVKTMLMDDDGNLWFGTERGITVIEDWAYQQIWDQ